MKKIYIRCNGGHYFTCDNDNLACPYDGWDGRDPSIVKELNQIINKLSVKDEEISIDLLKQMGASEDTIKRTIIIEFGNPKSAFEAIVPSNYVINGKLINFLDLDSNFK
jgi:hypothetical protein